MFSLLEATLHALQYKLPSSRETILEMFNRSSKFFITFYATEPKIQLDSFVTLYREQNLWVPARVVKIVGETVTFLSSDSPFYTTCSLDSQNILPSEQLIDFVKTKGDRVDIIFSNKAVPATIVDVIKIANNGFDVTHYKVGPRLLNPTAQECRLFLRFYDDFKIKYDSNGTPFIGFDESFDFMIASFSPKISHFGDFTIRHIVARKYQNVAD